jgi:hypothetical protein
MDHELAEKVSGLASRVSDLAALHAGDTGKTLMEQEDQLAQLALAAITSDLRSERASYADALQGVNAAIECIGKADRQLDDVADDIKLVAKAISLVTKALAAA